MNIVQHILIFGVRVYRWTLSPAQKLLFGPAAGCRFTPSCSEYALEALARHGAIHGSVLAVKRICRCHPWSECGHDPVPGKVRSAYAGASADKRAILLREGHGGQEFEARASGSAAALAAIANQKSQIKNSAALSR